MEMQNSRLLPASRRVVWEALNDTRILRDCIAGCERLEQVEADLYAMTVTTVVGPVKARFSGRLRLADLDPPRSYRIEFDGQGGAAGFGKGRATVVLSDADAGTVLTYSVTAQVGGKLAQVGSRLVDAAARKLAADFFDRFERIVATAQGDEPTSALSTSTPALPAALRFWSLRAAAVFGAITALVTVVWWFL